MTGIEDPSLRDAAHPDYFASAWQARHYAEAALGHAIPRQDIGLAVNSRPGRSQDQLHIHIDCLRPDIRDELGAHGGDITASWAQFPEPLSGHKYLARRIEAETPDGIDPFALLADGIPGAAGDMADYTLVLAGTSSETGTPGFILLAGHADPATGNRASGEELLDHECAVAR